MAFGAPTGGQLSYSTVSPAAVQGAQAFADAPQANADKAQKLAEAQAGTATAKNTAAEAPGKQAADVATNEAALSEAQQKKQTIALSNLARVSAMPNVANSPAGLKMLKTAADAAGLEIPKTVNGLPDIDALKQMTATPVKNFSELSTAEYKDQQARPPADRTNFPGAPADWMSRKAVTPLTEKGLEQAHAPVMKAEALFAAGKGNTYNLAQNLLAAAQYEKAQLTAHGESTEGVDNILTADGKSLRPEYLKQKAVDLAQATADKEKALGVHYTDEDKVAQERVDQTVRAWENPSAYQKLQIGLGDRRIASAAANNASRIAIAGANLNARLQSMQYAQQRGDITLAGTIAKDAQSAIGSAQSRLTSTTNVLNSMAQNPKMRKSEQYTNLLNQATDLQNFISTNGPTFQATAENARGEQARMYQQITGQQAAAPNVTVNLTTPGGPQGQQFGSHPPAVPAGTKPAATLKGKPIYLVGNKYVFGDGTDAK
jgi:hypothetical protein